MHYIKGYVSVCVKLDLMFANVINFRLSGISLLMIITVGLLDHGYYR